MLPRSFSKVAQYMLSINQYNQYDKHKIFLAPGINAFPACDTSSILQAPEISGMWQPRG